MNDIRITPSPYGRFEYVPSGGHVLDAHEFADFLAVIWEGRGDYSSRDRLREKFPTSEHDEARLQRNPETLARIKSALASTECDTEITAPAEPAEEAKPCGSNSVTLGWCKLTARHEGLHTNGTYLWGTPSEPDPPTPAEPVKSQLDALAPFKAVQP